MGRNCLSAWDGTPVDLNTLSKLEMNPSQVKSTVQLPRYTLMNSTLPYILGISVVLGEENDYPLLYREQMLLIMPYANHEIVGMTQSTRSVEFNRRTKTNIYLKSRESPLPLTKPSYLKMFHQVKTAYSASFRSDFNPENVMVVDALNAPKGGGCVTSLDPYGQSVDSRIGSFSVFFACMDWTGSDSDAYPLSYHFGIVYR